MLWFGLQLSLSPSSIRRPDTVGTWTKWQMVLLVGASNFIQQIYQAFFLTNCTNLSELVRTGKMDFLLLLPVNTRFLVSLRRWTWARSSTPLFAVCVMVFAAREIASASHAAADRGLRRAVRGGHFDPLFADVHPGDD